MICIIALAVFGIMAIFSAKYRPLAKEAWNCVFRKLTLRKCETGLNERIKAQVAGKIMGKSPRTAGFVFRHFELLSWVIVIITLASLAYTAYGGYNYYYYGNCNGAEDGGFCPFAALGGETKSGFESNYTGPMRYPTVDDDPGIGPENAKVVVIEFGCYMCPYTKKAEPTVKELLKKYEGRIRFVYRDFPLQQHKETMLHALAADCANEQEKFWEMHDALFAMQEICRELDDHNGMIMRAAEELNLDLGNFTACLESGRYEAEVKNDVEAGVMAGIMGTPTFFINNRTITGPKPIAAFEKVIDEELAK